jgi:excisionase family DNA binding protein
VLPLIAARTRERKGLNVTVKEFSERAEISLSLAYALVEEGRVPHRRIGRRGRRGKISIREEDLERFLESVKVEVEAGT